MIQVVADSASSIPPDLARQLGIHLVPMKVLFGEETYLDGVNLTSGEFYERLSNGRALPTTSQPSAGELLQVFDRLTEKGDEVLCVLISHLMSGTLSSAEAARDMLPTRSIHIFNSLSVSVGEGLMAMAAAEMAREGQTMEAILARLERMRSQMRVYFVVDTLEYLQRGGRIGGATAMIGTLLKVKPLLTIENGRIEPMEKVRTKPKAVERMLTVMAEQVGARQPVWAAVAHSNCPDQVEELVQEMRNRFDCRHMLIGDTGPTVAVHGGPGILGIATCPVDS